MLVQTTIYLWATFNPNPFVCLIKKYQNIFFTIIIFVSLSKTNLDLTKNGKHYRVITFLCLPIRPMQ